MKYSINIFFKKDREKSKRKKKRKKKEKKKPLKGQKDITIYKHERDKLG